MIDPAIVELLQGRGGDYKKILDLLASQARALEEAQRVWQELVNEVSCTSPDGSAEIAQVRYLKAAQAEIARLKANFATQSRIDGERIEQAEAARAQLERERTMPDVGVFCAHCGHTIAACPSCGKAEWRKQDAALATPVRPTEDEDLTRRDTTDG